MMSLTKFPVSHTNQMKILLFQKRMLLYYRNGGYNKEKETYLHYAWNDESELELVEQYCLHSASEGPKWSSLFTYINIDSRKKK